MNLVFRRRVSHARVVPNSLERYEGVAILVHLLARRSKFVERVVNLAMHTDAREEASLRLSGNECVHCVQEGYRIVTERRYLKFSAIINVLGHLSAHCDPYQIRPEARLVIDGDRRHADHEKSQQRDQ